MKLGNASALMLSGMVLLAGCTVTKPRLTPLDDPAYDKLAAFEFANERVGTGGKPQQLGIALSGGGTRAAQFSMGVLRGLYEQGILQQADVLSSVSGGGYTAYFYYARMMQLADEKAAGKAAWPDGLGSIFDDCLPMVYAPICDVHTGNRCTIQGLDRGLRLCSSFAHTMDHDASDPYRFQGHVRGFQNVLSADPTFLPDSAERLLLPTAHQWANLLAGTVTTAPSYFVGNGLFDWHADVSASKEIYRKGIVRTYGADPIPCAPSGCADRRPLPPEAALRPEEEFIRLRDLYDDQPRPSCPSWVDKAQTCKVPLWIINATTDNSEIAVEAFDLGGKANVEVTSFEITPLGARSRFYGDARGFRPVVFEGPPPAKAPLLLPPGFTLDRAVAASGAFLDSRQRDMLRPLRGPATFLFNLLGLNWGSGFRNPSTDLSVAEYHRMLPWPLYYLHRYEHDEQSVDIYLTDGGQSENTGLWALARRGVKNILFVDAGYDRSGTLYDLCRVKATLRERGLELSLPALERFNGPWQGSLCHETIAFYDHDKQNMAYFRDDRRGYSIFDWHNPVLQGCIFAPDRTATDEDRKKNLVGGDGRLTMDVVEARMEQRNGTFVCPRTEAEGLRSRLYMVKLALEDASGSDLDQAVAACSPLMDGSSREDQRERCRHALQPLTRIPLPVELVGFLSKEMWDGKTEPHSKQLMFPQPKTESSTEYSNSYVFGGYRELGRWYAHHLQLLDPKHADRGLTVAAPEVAQDVCKYQGDDHASSC